MSEVVKYHRESSIRHKYVELLRLVGGEVIRSCAVRRSQFIDEYQALAAAKIKAFAFSDRGAMVQVKGLG